ncbi:MAG: DUF2837 family protein [Phycisphaerae bacterium]|nr:DUF2837 family protein [Phycisphaerae bacterium]
MTEATEDFRWLLLSATLTTIAGAFLIPTFQRLSARYVEAFDRYRSLWAITSVGVSGSRRFQ